MHPGINRFLAAGVVVLMLIPTPGFGLARGECDDPFIFRDATVQAFIVPYTASGPLSKKAQALVTTLHRHVLFAALKYPGIAVEELVAGQGAPCEGVAAKNRIQSQLSKGQVAVFLSGRIFEQRDTVYMESWVSVTNPSGSKLSWALKGSGGTVSATIPENTMSFAARAIPVNMLGELESAAERMGRVHEAPDVAV
jgi:hypothetical protein